MEQGLVKYIDEARNALVVSAKPENLCIALQKNEIVSTSVFSGPVMTEDKVSAMIAKLTALFDKENPVKISELCNTILAEKWTVQRAAYVYEQLKRHEYPTFTLGKFLKMDKTITFGRSEYALRRKLNFTITKNEIVIVKLIRTYTDSEGVEQQDWIRAYAYKDEAEEIMPERIIGRWNDTEHTFEFIGDNFFDHTIEGRRESFKKSLYEKCNAPPNHNGPYPIPVVKSFYEYWSRVIPPGDMLLFESRISFTLDSALETWNKRYQQQNNEKSYRDD